MSFNRRKNIFTLGDLHHNFPHPTKAQLSRRQNSDPFERDPFKIQSFNFHYADRPTFPLQSFGAANRVGAQSSQAKHFETFYYNYDFAPARPDKANPPHAGNNNNFHDNRRRKFLQAQTATIPTTPAVSYIDHHHRPNQAASVGVAVAPGSSYISSSMAACQEARNASTIGTLISDTGSGSGIGSCYGSAAGSGSGSSAIVRNTITASLQRTPGHHRSEQIHGHRSLPAAGASPSRSGVHSFLHQHQHQQHQHQQPSSQSQPKFRQHPFAICNDAVGSGSRTSLAGSGTGSARGRRLLGDVVYNGSSAAVAAGSDRRLPPQRVGSSTRTTSSSHQHRRPLQAIHVSSKNGLNNGGAGGGGGGGSRSGSGGRGSASGCQINININGLDDSLLGENLTIKIESDGSNPKLASNQNPTTQTNDLNRPSMVNRAQTTLNIRPSRSSHDSFVVEKRRSQMSLRERRSSSQVRNEGGRGERARDVAVVKPVAVATVQRNTSSERMPSIVPWRLEDNLRVRCKENRNPLEGISYVSAVSPALQERRNRALAHDLKNQRKHERALGSKTTTTTSTSSSSGTRTTRSTSSRLHEKLLNTTTTTSTSPGLGRQESRQSLRCNRNMATTTTTATPRRNSETRFQHSSSPVVIQGRRRCSSPVNVNINVYTDKLRLLRV